MTAAEAEEVVGRVVAALVPGLGEPVDVSATFRDLGLDSLDILNVIVDTEEALGVQVADEEIPRLHTPAALAARVVELL